MLKRFVLLFTEIQNFILDKEMFETFPDIWNEEWISDLYFLSDISSHFNELNLKLQGKDKLICDLSKSVIEFRLKLELFIQQLSDYDFTHFESLGMLAETSEINCTIYIVEMQIPRHDLELDLIKIKSAIVNKRHENEETIDMWRRILILNKPIFVEAAMLFFFSMFGSTWTCESTFSIMKNIKTDIRSRLADENLEAEIRCKVSNYLPNFRKLIKEVNCQASH